MNRLTAAVAAGALLLAACGDDATDEGPGASAAPSTEPAGEAPASAPATAPPGTSVTLVAYESFPTDPDGPIAAAFADFAAETGIEVEVLIAGDTGTMLSKAELTAGNPEGDVIWGIDNAFLSRAVGSGVFDGEPAPVDFGDVCVNYDIAALDELGVPAPHDLADLTDPIYDGLLVVENPATSSPGLAFLLATVAEFGTDPEGGWEAYWDALRTNDVLVVDSWSQAYYEEFTFSGGSRPLSVSYGSSPPYEAIYAEQPVTPESGGVSTGVAEGTCFRQTEYAGVLRGTDQPEAAGQLVDFLLSERFQREIALNLFVFPINPDVELDPEFTEYAVIPDAPLSLDPAEIDANRAEWIDRWTEVVTG